MITYLFAVLLLTAATCQNTDMKPTCNVPYTFSSIPVALKETQIFNMDNFITGFNLRLEIHDKPDYVQLSDKFVKKAGRAVPQRGLCSYHLDHVDNSWGTNFITISEQNFTTTVRWGRMNITESIPQITGEVTIQTQNIVCFDAVLFMELGLAMVDCATRVGSDMLGFGYSNKFVYIDTINKVVLPTMVDNELYVPYTRIRHRRFFKYTEDGYHYLMRIYFADGVDDANRENTYFEIMSANNPKKPFVLKVIDRSFLDLDRMAIMDFKLYLGDMYLLDYHQGVLRLDITGSQQLIITGRYRTDSGFTKMGVYSNNLDNQYLLVLSNRHAIYEIDWTDQIRPKLVTKYSLMANSSVISLNVNHKYVVVQSESNTTTGNLYNMTWVFTRGSRIYSNAYAVISHTSPNTLIDLNRQFSFIMSIDQDNIQLWELNSPKLLINPSPDSLVGQQAIFSIVGTSTNPVTNRSTMCTFTYKLVVVKPDNFTLWPTGLTPAKEYYANYPGELYIPLNRYVMGPNITWDVNETAVSGELPPHWILQQNKSYIEWDSFPSLNKLSLLRQEQYDSLERTTLYVYMQDIQNKTYVGECRTEEFRANVSCTNIRFSTDQDRILNFTVNRFHIYGGRFMHIAAIVFASKPNQIIVRNIESDRQMFRLKLGEGYNGRASSIEFAQQFLIVVLKYAKQIRIYDVVYCVDFDVCRPLYNITAQMMYNMGVEYFAPLEVYTSDFHPSVMFIQTTESVLILDLTRKGPIVLGNIVSPGTKELGYWGWKMAISQDHLVIVNAPNIIEQHNLMDLRSKSTFLARNYPLYYYNIPEKFDLDFSDAGGLVYITAKDTITNKSVLLVYRAGMPTVATFYDVFNIDANYDDILVDVTGTFADYVLFSAGNSLTLFRQYQIPILVFEDTFSDFVFNLSYTNSHNTDHKSLVNSTVRIANYPVDVKINDPKLNDKNFLNSLLQYKDDERSYVINDHGWFNGSVVNYTLKCESECGPIGKIQIVNHVQQARDVVNWYGMQDYAFTLEGGVVQQAQTIVTILHNGTIQEYIDMPTLLFGEVCTSVSVNFLGNGYVSGCISDNEVYLYYTTKVAHKPFVVGPQISSAQGLAKLEMIQNLLFLTDVDQNPQFRQRQGGVIIYVVNANIDEPEMFDEIEVIDSNDFIAAQGWTLDKAYIVNSHLAWTNSSELYRLFITELTNGLFVVDFKWRPGFDEINVVQMSFINLKEMLINESLPLPNSATFQAVTILSQSYDAKNQNWLIDLIVSIRNFHNVHLSIFIGPDYKVLHSEIKHIYYRYSFYESTNYIKAFDGYFATVQKIPAVYQTVDWWTRQLLVVYDTRPNRTETVTKNLGPTMINGSHMLGAIVINDLGRVAFDFNFTFRRDETDPFSNIGLVMVDSRGEYIREITISESLHIKTKSGIKKTQNVQLTANNDYSSVKLPITIKIDEVNPQPQPQPGSGNLPGWAIALIVIGSVGLGAAGAYFGWRCWKTRKMDLSEPGLEQRQSLITQDGENRTDTDRTATTHLSHFPPTGESTDIPSANFSLTEPPVSDVAPVDQLPVQVVPASTEPAEREGELNQQQVAEPKNSPLDAVESINHPEDKEN